MTELVKITADEDGFEVYEPAWCLVDAYGDASRVLCSGQVFGFGEGDAAYKTKEVKRGGITCSECLEKIKQIKSVKL